MNYPQIKPTLNLDFSNTKTLDPRINFRRGTPGAYYDGVTHVKAEENLIDYSEDFSQWGAGTDISIINNDNIAPDGSLTASLIDDGTNAGYKQFYKSINVQDGVYFASIYVKNPESDGRRFLILSCYWNSGSYATITFDTLTETIQKDELGNFKVISSFASDVGDGWYRIGLNFSLNSHPSLTFNVNMSNSVDATWGRTYTGSNQQLYIWGAQLEQRDSLTAYTPTNGNPITKYQPQLMFASPDQPRFDHDPITGESKGLLIEESRTNLAWYSENFAVKGISNPESAWLYTRCSLDTNGPISPDGTTRSVIMRHDTTVTNGGGLYMSGGSDLDDKYIPAGTNTYSWYAKNAGVNFFVINTGGNKIFFDLTNGTAKSFANLIDSYGIEHVGNGWYRCHVVTSQATNLYFYQSDQDNDGTTTVSGSGGVAVWGPQFEQGSFPTSYIKTSGASATRSADNASITGENFSSWYRQDEGSIVCEGSIDMNKTKGGTGMPLYNVLRDTTSLLGLSRDSSSWYHSIINNTISNFEYWNNVKSVTGAITYNYNDGYIHSYINGNQNLSSTTWLREKDIVHEQSETLKLGTGGSVDNVLNGHIKKLSYYPQRLTNEQLQQLTK